jgi:hypothetical protein
MAGQFSRRDFLRAAVAAGVGFGAVAGGAQAYYKTRDLIDQHETWVEASRPNGEFLARHATDLQRLTLGASFAPEQFGGRREQREEALAALRLAHEALGVTQLRLGVRWNRVQRRDGQLTFAAYKPTWDYALDNGFDVAANLGPIRTFRWPEDHVPGHVLEQTPQKTYATLTPSAPLSQRAFDYVLQLTELLKHEYGPALENVRALQPENEPFYPMGQSDWQFDRAYVLHLTELLDAALPGRDILVTTAGRLNLDDIHGMYAEMLREERWRGRLVSGFDFHFRTPKRERMPVLRYFDQINYAHPFAETTAQHIEASRKLGFTIEVTEGQMEPFHHLTSPGNSVRDLRFLILRCLDRVLDPQRPALLRIWGIEELSKRMLRGEMTQEHRQIVELFEAINAPSLGGPVAERSSP